MSLLTFAGLAFTALGCLGTWVGAYYARRSDRAKGSPSYPTVTRRRSWRLVISVARS